MMTHKARSRVSGELVGFLVSAPLTENIDLPDKGPQVACAAIVHFPTKASHVEGASVIRHFLLDPSDSSVSIHVHTLPIRENAVRLNLFPVMPTPHPDIAIVTMQRPDGQFTIEMDIDSEMHLLATVLCLVLRAIENKAYTLGPETLSRQQKRKRGRNKTDRDWLILTQTKRIQ